MPPAVTVLQLDTHFPRIAGDVGCAQSYALPMEVIRVPSATVQNVVNDRPDLIDIAPFEDALRQARGQSSSHRADFCRIGSLICNH